MLNIVFPELIVLTSGTGLPSALPSDPDIEILRSYNNLLSTDILLYTPYICPELSPTSSVILPYPYITRSFYPYTVRGSGRTTSAVTSLTRLFVFLPLVYFLFVYLPFVFFPFPRFIIAPPSLVYISFYIDYTLPLLFYI